MAHNGTTDAQPTAANRETRCGYRMWPAGPSCDLLIGHPITATTGHMWNGNPHVSWTYTSCWRLVGEGRVCIQPEDHEPNENCDKTGEVASP